MTRLRHAALAAALAGSLVAAGGCGSGFDDNGSATTQQSAGPADLKIMIASSGAAETKAVQDAAARWATGSGSKATVTPAQDIVQQLGQALAGSTPPDVFYVDAARFADYASVGALEPYAQGLALSCPTCGRASPTRTSCTACPRTPRRWPCRSTPTCGRRPG